MTTLEELIRNDLDKPVCRWSDLDKQSWRDVYGRLPSRCRGCDGAGPCAKLQEGSS